jgi:hypothetical protein
VIAVAIVKVGIASFAAVVAAVVPVTVMDTCWPTLAAIVVGAVASEARIKVTTPEVESVALDGTADMIPKPNADTATSAIRLIDVFVDICFLSIKVDFEDFSRSAWLKKTHSSDMSEPFLSVAWL